MVKFESIHIPETSNFFVVEDTLIYQKRIMSCLKDLGFTGGAITVAPSLAQAKEMIIGKSPDFILCDWNLPDGIGLDFVKWIREKMEFSNIPILMVTTMGDTSDIIHAMQVGADIYVVKPFYPDAVLEALAFAYEKRSSNGLSWNSKLR